MFFLNRALLFLIVGFLFFCRSSEAALSAPILLTATNIEPYRFTAQWNASASATGYLLDVSTNNVMPTGGSTTTIFSDNFESGTLAGWTQSSYGGWSNSSYKSIQGSHSLCATVPVYDDWARLSHPLTGLSNLSADITWRFQLRHGHQPDSSENWGVFLFADQAAQEMYPGAWDINGYVLGVDYSFGTDHHLKLSRIDFGQNMTVIDTQFNWPNNISTNQAAGLEVKRSSDGLWSIKVDANGGFDNLVATGTNNVDNVNTNANFFGVTYAQFNGSASSNLWVDDVSVTKSAGGGGDFVSGYNSRSVAGTSQVVTGLTPSITYYYRVRATNATETSANSSAGNVTTLSNTLPSPSVLAATGISSNQFVANWSLVNQATGYWLDVATNNAFFSGGNTEMVSDNFESGSITNWTQAQTNRWSASTDQPVSGSYSLHHTYDNSLSGTDRVSRTLTALNLNSAPTVWRFQVRYGAAPSANNNWNVFLFADQDAAQMRPGGTANGYALGVNYTGSDDTVKLWRVTSGAATAILTSTLNWETSVGTSSAAGLEVTRSANGVWSLKIDSNGGFDGLVNYGSATDASYTNATYFGVCYKYTASQDRQLWIDDLSLVQTGGSVSACLTGYQNRSVAGANEAVTGLTSGATYYYRVRATNSFAVSSYSSTTSVTTAFLLSYSNWAATDGLNAAVSGGLDQDDSDGDGVNNGEEYVCDTNPTNFNSHYDNVVTNYSGNQTVTLQVGPPTTNSRLYNLWATTNLLAGNWMDLQLNRQGADNGGPLVFTITNVNPSAYYRTGVKVP